MMASQNTNESEEFIMSNGITLSPKYGVNPTIPVCFFCGEKKDEIALLGRIGGKQDLEAPKRVALDYEPCDKCKEQWAKGVALIEVTSVPFPDNRPAIQGVYPTGRCVVVVPEALKGDFKPGDRAFVMTEDFQQMFQFN